MTPPEIQQKLEQEFAGLTLGGNHQYRVGRKWIPGVTTILKKLDKSDALLVWAARLAEQHGDPWAYKSFRQKAKDLGTETHALIEHSCRQMVGIDEPAPPVSDQAHYVFAGWQEWAEQVELQPILVEGRCYSRAHWFAGTFDLLALVNGQLTVCDWKTSKNGRVYAEHKLQNHAYRAAIQEAGIPDVDGCVVTLPKESENGSAMSIRPHYLPWNDATWEAFLGLRRVYLWSLEDERAAG